MLLEARLRAFQAVAEARSFVGAARRLHLSQPAVSKHIAALEREIGVALVIRRPVFQLTPAGEFLAGYVMRAGALLAQAERGVRALAEAEVGTLRIAALDARHVPRPASCAGSSSTAPTSRWPFSSGHPRRPLRPSITTKSSSASSAASAGAPSGVEPILDDDVVLVAAPSLRRSRLRPSEIDDLLWVHHEEGSQPASPSKRRCERSAPHHGAASRCRRGKPSSSSSPTAAPSPP